ncbi:MAG: sigma-70 family RNA polymerase sigma factor [Oscillospiraceae bacterium]|nr:sigma-70 family RNA polymerase sigma factor [Oscillospiraceae bacterium]
MDTANAAFIEQNLGLVHLCANRFRGKGIEYEDMYSAGCIGLLKAAKAFDESRGVRFSTYAVPVILGEIKRLFRDGGTIKVSRSLKELSLKTVRLREKIIKETGKDPPVSELAEKLSTTPEMISEALCVSAPPVSLTADYDDNHSEIDIPVPSPDEEIGDFISLSQVMSELPSDDRKLIYMRYFENKTQSDTAKTLGMTQVQVSRREKKLLGQMREVLLR